MKTILTFSKPHHKKPVYPVYPDNPINPVQTINP
jgi:hypothetical protein